MIMLRKLTVFTLFLALVFSPLSAFAHTEDEPHKEATESAAQKEVNSFELFWPLVAGKTMDDGFIYTLKRLKETIRGWFVFGTTQKADYAVFLATKRVLEAEKLIKEEKTDLADKTLGSAVSQLEVAEANANAVLGKGENLGEAGANMKNRLSNIEKLVAWLTTRSQENRELLQEVLDKTRLLIGKL